MAGLGGNQLRAHPQDLTREPAVQAWERLEELLLIWKIFLVASVHLMLSRGDTPWKDLVGVQLKICSKKTFVILGRKRSPSLTGMCPISVPMGPSGRSENSGLGKIEMSHLLPHDKLMQLKSGKTA